MIKRVIILQNGKESGRPYDISIQDGIITAISESEESATEPAIYATAGYIDIHTHGGYGKDYFECTQEAADAVGKFHLDNGTTAFCATAVATPLPQMDKQIATIRTVKNNYASMIGLHLEGPFISIVRKGAQPESNIRTEFEDKDREFFVKNKDMLKIMTMCPHTANATKLVETLVANGIIAHAGHDDSIYPEIDACINSGLNGATHIYCASSVLTRRPGDLTKYIGLNETALLREEIFTEVIADNMHISDLLFKFIYKNKGYKNMCVVSDSLSAAGMPKGYYKLGKDIGVYNNGEVVLLDTMKALAGSICPLSKMVKNIVGYGIPLAEAVYMANQAPAKHLGLTNMGKIVVGCVADINLLDKEGNLLCTYKNGNKVVDNQK